jgi:type IV secretion system protein VirD4
MQHFLQRSDFDLEKLMDGDTDLFLVVPLDQLQSLSVFLRLMVNIIAGVAIRNMAHRVSAKSLLLVLDEFTRLGRMQKLLDIATVAAGAGVEALFVSQDRAQIASVYPHGEADTLLGACATVRAFGLGRTDMVTADWIISCVGDRTVQTRSRQLEGRKRGSGSEQRTKLFSPDQLLELPSDEMVGLFPGRPPLRLKRIISHTDPAYRDRIDRNPTIPI